MAGFRRKRPPERRFGAAPAGCCGVDSGGVCRHRRTQRHFRAGESPKFHLSLPRFRLDGKENGDVFSPSSPTIVRRHAPGNSRYAPGYENKSLPTALLVLVPLPSKSSVAGSTITHLLDMSFALPRFLTMLRFTAFQIIGNATMDNSIAHLEVVFVGVSIV